MIGAGGSMMILINAVSKFTDNYLVIGAVSGAIAGASKGFYERKVNYNLSYFSKGSLNFDDDLDYIIGNDTYDAPETEETEEEEE
jgi:hypothetical protein